jgi:uncharacterized protein
MALIGRHTERAILDNLYNSKKPELLVLYGRRRIGKTYLIRKHFENRLCFDFVGSHKESTHIQLANFNRAFKEQCSNKYPNAQNWSEAFEQLAKYLKTLPKTKKAVVFFDEFPWLDKPKANFLGAFEYFWNQHASKLNHVLFIACGSVASWVIKNLINNYGGLHNRVTQQLEIKPFSLHETEEILKARSLRFTQYQIVQLYMATGGIPFYLDAVPKASSIHQVIDKLFFVANSAFANEFNSLYASLFKKPEVYIQVIKTLAQHYYGLSRQQLLEQINIPAGGSFNRIMQQLEECGFVAKARPYGKKNREALFRVIDNFSVFYLQFVQNNKSKRLGVWQSLADTNMYKTWCGYAFENICLQHLPQIHAALGITGLYTEVTAWKIGKNEMGNGTQIDLIIDRKDGITHLCEIKFTNKPLLTTEAMVKTLAHRRALFEYFNKTRKNIVTTFITSFAATQNKYYKDEVFAEISLEQLFLQV